MRSINNDPRKALRLSNGGIVIQSAQGDEVRADYWQGDEEKVRQTLENMAGASETQLRFTLRARG